NNDKESTVWTRFRDKELDIKLPIPYLRCKPKDWKDGKCKSSSLKMADSDLDTINVRLTKLEANILSKYKDDGPEIDVKGWLELVIEPQKAKVQSDNYPEDVISFIDVYISLKKDSVAESTIKKAKVVKNLLSRY
ncbi:hypothetical protein, partial [Elizabethkingia miricola]